MISRNIEKILFSFLQKFPAVNIIRPRQSGKTTLVKLLKNDYSYFSLENSDTSRVAEQGFKSN
jgi:predicted AAA+ superfamily ATPase